MAEGILRVTWLDRDEADESDITEEAFNVASYIAALPQDRINKLVSIAVGESMSVHFGNVVSMGTLTRNRGVDDTLCKLERTGIREFFVRADGTLFNPFDDGCSLTLGDNGTLLHHTLIISSLKAA